MAERTYMLALDAGVSDLEKVCQWIMTSGTCSAWWNHLPMVFIIESELSTAAISEKLHALVPETHFLLTEVDLADARGWLPEISWKWVEKRALSSTAQHSMRV
jgi:hypothetical protein